MGMYKTKNTRKWQALILRGNRRPERGQLPISERWRLNKEDGEMETDTNT